MPKKVKYYPPLKKPLNPLPEVVPTCQQFYTAPCCHCAGTGVTAHHPGGWWLDYGGVVKGPLTKTEAVKTVRDHTGVLRPPTLIGPDGRVYELARGEQEI